MSIIETSKQWVISERRIRVLCSEGRIIGAFKTGKTWNIHLESTKPLDNRMRSKKIHFEGIDMIDFDEVNLLVDKYSKLKPLTQSQLKTIRDDLNLRWTFNSNAIEGNTLTLKETKVALEGITIGGKSLVEHLEVVNHYSALKYLEGIVIGPLCLSERIIKDIHRLILVNIDNKNARAYRNENVLISGADHKPPKHYHVQQLVKEFVDNVESVFNKYHPIIKAALVHGEFVKIHPFTDGNGRTSRIIMNFSLISSRLIPVVIKKEDRLAYYNALDKAHTTSNYKDFVELIKNSLIDEYNLRIDLLS